MLTQLSISNFAIIKNLDITLRPGLNILSGETGAGKSIIINAVNLILGGRASSDLIRSGCEEARVEGLFSLPNNKSLSELLTELDLYFDGELLIKRTIFRQGRNRIMINGSMATLQMLSRIGCLLISISGQHEHQQLLKPENHLFLLDDFGGLSDERNQLAEVFRRYESIAARIRRLEKEITETEEKQELTRFQIDEIEKAEVTTGEDIRLSREKTSLQHAEEILNIVVEAYQTLYEKTPSALSHISGFTKKLDRAAQLEPRLGPIRDILSEIEVRLEDVSISLRDFQQKIIIDPKRLDQVMERIDLLNRLKRKYGPGLEDVLKFKQKLDTMIFDLEESKKKLEQLSHERLETETELLRLSEALSQKRKKASLALTKALEKELHQLHMSDTKFKVEFNHDNKEKAARKKLKTGPDGFDQVEFLISPNVGEELKPLAKIASGGELSRIMLAVKTILARTASVETIVFDEVDSGISGATAEVIGEKLLTLAEYHQILCITHLPQIASQGETHFLVKKDIIDKRTEAAILELEPESRVHEIARLLGGREITPRALAHAREMLG